MSNIVFLLLHRQTQWRLRVNALDAFVLGFEQVLWDPSTKKLYDGVKESLSTTDMPFYVISEASPSDVSTALKQDAGVAIPADSPRLMQANDAAAKLSALKQVVSIAREGGDVAAGHVKFTRTDASTEMQ